MNEVTDTKNAQPFEEELSKRLSSLETFIARRFDEISMEINATSQMIDMTEEALGKKFSDILNVLDAVGNVDGGKTSSNSGYELDVVVDQTEKATNDIMDAADRIDTKMKDDKAWEDAKKRKALISDVRKEIETIMLSCSFQDLTGQRINKAVSNIREAEQRLSQILQDLGLQVESVKNLSTGLITGTIASQDDIDSLFSEARKKLNKK